MAIAVIPINESIDLSNQTNWLSMSQADKMICEHFEIEEHQTKFYKNWFNNFFYFDWRRAKKFSNNDTYLEFSNANSALTYYFHEYNVRYEDILDDKKFIDENVKDIVEAIYVCGYKIVSLNIR